MFCHALKIQDTKQEGQDMEYGVQNMVGQSGTQTGECDTEFWLWNGRRKTWAAAC